MTHVICHFLSAGPVCTPNVSPTISTGAKHNVACCKPQQIACYMHLQTATIALMDSCPGICATSLQVREMPGAPTHLHNSAYATDFKTVSFANFPARFAAS